MDSKDNEVAITKLCEAVSTLSETAQIGSSTIRGVYELFASSIDIPMHVRTGDNSLGSPTELKTYKHIDFHGREDSGTARVRIYIDGRYVCDARVSMSTSPKTHRRVNIPIGKRVGHSIDIEFATQGKISALEVGFDPMRSTSD